MLFEELCTQLARVETPPGAEFVRKGAPDAGVECYCKLQDGSEWGWQAKYFNASLTSTQWQQLDKSVKRAIEKHPALVRYFVCVPLDRTDARIRGRQSSLQQWEAHVAKWANWAQERCMNVDFVWWGSSELVNRLYQTDQIGRVYFWLGSRLFDEDWFRKNYRQARNAAGPRYSPELHVDLPIAEKIELFGRTDFALNQMKFLAKEIRQGLSYVRHASSNYEDSSQRIDLAELSRSVNVEELLESGKDVLDCLSVLEFVPTDDSPLDDTIARVEAARDLADRTIKSLDDLRRDYDSKSHDDTESPYYSNPIDRLRDSVLSFRYRIDSASYRLCQAAKVANSRLMIIEGMAGTGKTHLLCDISRSRIETGAPTVLLMGQRFTTTEVPWTQILQQLELNNTTVEEFVGALESAAQASNCRALFVVDALNEGEGHEIWPKHLSAFLAQLECSPWISVLLSVRSPYRDSIIPKDVRDQALVEVHYGFSDNEYDAVARFFSHYELELPSAPILQPEFSNPLFLKIICESLNARGETRLTTGLQGITEFFEFYLKSVNLQLAKALDYDPDRSLVQEALREIAKCLAKGESRTLPRRTAQEVVDQLLPNRSFANSLYLGLVNEGVLFEDIDWRKENGKEKITSIAYERFADHIIVDYLLQTHLDLNDHDAAFKVGGGLAFLDNEDVYVRASLVEALCVQIPEQTGKELLRLAPNLKEKPNLGHAFGQSIVWRKLDAFTNDTLDCFNEVHQNKGALEETLDVLLTVATVDKHPFNAELLDRNLRSYSMPDRDEWWSTYLHDAYQTNSAVDRLVDWALGLDSNADLEEMTIDLSATTLAWMLTTSNRFLRDRATKALVSLLTDRLDAMARLIERFSDVDDLYVTERVYAAAYGAAMRSYDATAVGVLALTVYERVFASGTPPAHILLRDYARGVIERALFLGSELQVDQQAICPPYRSDWPAIPDERATEALKPDITRGSYDSGELEWAWSRLHFLSDG